MRICFAQGKDPFCTALLSDIIQITRVHVVFHLMCDWSFRRYLKGVSDAFRTVVVTIELPRFLLLGGLASGLVNVEPPCSSLPLHVK